MKKLVLALFTGMAMLAIAVVATMAMSSDNNTVEAKKTEEAVLEFTLEVDPRASVATIVDAVRKAANIGSSGQDGFQFDSFFDVAYRVAPSDDGTLSAVVDIEIHAVPNSSDLNPGTIIDNVLAAVGGKKHKHKGHVTILK